MSVVETFKLKKPSTIGRIKKLFKATEISDGEYRRAFRLPEGLIVKVPKDTDPNSSEVRHARFEIDAHKKILKTKKLLPLRRYLPDFLYTDRKYGIIVCPEYEQLEEAETVSKIMGDLIEDLTGESCNDMHSSNVMQDDDGNIKIIDLGYFFGCN